MQSLLRYPSMVTTVLSVAAIILQRCGLFVSCD